MTSRLLRAVFLAGCCALIAADSSAQASIAGTVTDPSGTPLPGVSVVASSAALFEGTRQVVTDEQGRYELPALPAGPYGLMFTMGGFIQVERSPFALASGERLATDVVLRPDPCDAPPGTVCMTPSEIESRIPLRYRSLWDLSSGYTEEQRWSALPCDAIVLANYGGFVFVPGSVYEVMLARGGRAEFKTFDADGSLLTVNSGAVTVFQFGRLCHLIELLGFDRLEPRYAPPQDTHGGIRVSVRYADRTVSVQDAGWMGPVELWAIQSAIERLKHDIAWQSH